MSAQLFFSGTRKRDVCRVSVLRQPVSSLLVKSGLGISIQRRFCDFFKLFAKIIGEKFGV